MTPALTVPQRRFLKVRTALWIFRVAAIAVLLALFFGLGILHA